MADRRGFEMTKEQAERVAEGMRHLIRRWGCDKPDQSRPSYTFWLGADAAEVA